MRWESVQAIDVKFSLDLTHQKAFNFWQSCLKNKKVDVFLGTQWIWVHRCADWLLWSKVKVIAGNDAKNQWPKKPREYNSFVNTWANFTKIRLYIPGPATNWCIKWSTSITWMTLTPYLSYQWRQCYPILVRDVFAFIDMLIRFWVKKSTVKVGNNLKNRVYTISL